MYKEPRRVLITGANGFIGRNLANYLSNKYDLTLSMRDKLRSDMPDFFFHSKNVIYTGCINRNTNWSDALHKCDIVVHLAGLAHASNDSQEFDSVNCDASCSLLKQSVAHGVKRFIFLSSIGVVGNDSALGKYTEKTDCNPNSLYAKSKLLAEKRLTKMAKDLDIELVIIRPPLVYGHDAPGSFSSLISLIRRVPILPFGAVINKKSFISINNLTSFIDVCISHPDAANETFLIADDHPISTLELINYIADSLGKRVMQLPIPLSVLRFLLRVVGKESISVQLLNNLVISNQKAKKLLSWIPSEEPEYRLRNLYFDK